MESVSIRPNIEDCGTGTEFRRWYYLKSELDDFAKTNGIPFNGGKFEIADRIEAALNNAPLPQRKKRNSTSRFDWANATLSSDVQITDNISFGPNVRSFFGSQIGPAFVCNSDFMDWVKEHVGSTLSDAVEAWRMLEAWKTDPEFQTRIRNHNQFTRDILTANPSLPLHVVRQIWKAKRELPLPMTYRSEDLRIVDDIITNLAERSSD